MAYHERLIISPGWAAIIAALIGSVAVVYLVWTPWPVALGVTAGLAAVAVAAVAAGTATVRVEADGLRVGPNLLEWTYVGDARHLDVEESRRRLGPRADARAFLCTRAWLPRVVEVTVDDPADPHPYWLVSSRHPEELADAIRRAAR